VAGRPSANLEVIPEGDDGSDQPADPQQGLCQLAQCLKYSECALSSSERAHDILGAFPQGIHLCLHGHQAVVDFSVRYIVVTHSAWEHPTLARPTEEELA